MALNPNVVDVPVGSLSQTPPEHSGPTGRMRDVKDAVYNRYTGEGGAKRVRLDPRPGFQSFTDEAHSSTTGLPETAVWASPQFLEPLGEQLLSINTSQPKVWDGTDWTNYGTRRIVTQKLSQEVAHAANSTIAAPDSAYLSGVTCMTWTEQTYVQDDDDQILNTVAYVGFRADDGAWIRTPSVLFLASSADNAYQLAKVVSDGQHFWTFFNQDFSDTTLGINVFGLNGNLVASATVDRIDPASPAVWDITRAPGENAVILAQQGSVGVDPGDDLGVKLTKFNLDPDDSSIIESTSNTIAAHCQGQVAWATNDLIANRVYLLTIGPVPEEFGRLWGYEINPSTLAIAHEYDVNRIPETMPDSMTGWVIAGALANQPTLFFVWSELADQEDVGPTFDPARRFTRTVRTTWADVTTDIRQTNSVILQSRAFAIDGEYHAYTYYQSGSGTSAPYAVEDYEGAEESDYFIGAPLQPITPVSGDYTTGQAFDKSGLRIRTSSAHTQESIQNGDEVEFITSGNDLFPSGVPTGTLVLRWTFADFTSPGVLISGSRLVIDDCSNAGANGTWDVLGIDSTGGQPNSVYTLTVATDGHGLTPSTFTGVGTFEVDAMAQYQIAGLEETIPVGMVSFFVGGTMVVTGAANGGNNGTKTIERVILGGTLYGGSNPSIWVTLTTEVTEIPSAFQASISAEDQNRWHFQNGHFITQDIGNTLVVSGTEIGANTDEFVIDAVDFPLAQTDSPDIDTVTAGLPERFNDVSTIEVAVRLANPGDAYILHVDDIDFDFTYIGAVLSLTGSGGSADGVYNIIEIIDEHTARLSPTNGVNTQRSAVMDSGVTIIIQRNQNVQPQTQPVWFVTPLTGSQPQVGCFEQGLAYADWRFDSTQPSGSAGQNRYRFALSSTSDPFITTRQVVLPFRVANFTQVTIAEVGQTQLDIANLSTASTVGLKVFQSQGRGEGTGDSGKLLVPGLLATEFTLSGFAENNFNVGPEAPFIVDQEEDTDTDFALTVGATYVVQVVIATRLENGDIVRSKPSPPITYTLTGDNNVATYGGRVVMPLDEDGLPVTNHYGTTNNRQATYEIYRSVIVDGVASAQLHLITNPANPNGLYGGTGTGSGFTFPDEFTWNYRDSNPDAGIRGTEVVYAGSLGQGIAPHFPLPAFKHATTWNGRRWVVGYDGAVWMSAELMEGEATWTFPGFRYPFPEEDPAVCVVGFENFLYMLCEHSIWRIPTTQLPNQTLTAGQMPQPVRMPFEMGCSGFAIACTDFVAYSSSMNDGRDLWAITRDLNNVYLSEPIAESINQPVSGLEFDSKQRLLMLVGDSNLWVFDTVAKEWAEWNPPSVPDLLTVYQGQPTYNDSEFILQQDDSAIVDTRDETEFPIPLDATFASLSFAQVRAVKRLWEAQIIGRRNGPCNINATIQYPDDEPGTTTTFGPEPVPSGDSMLLAINPEIEDAGTFDIRVFGSYEDIESPGRCFSLEMLSCEVGVDGGQGVKKLPDAKRIVAG